MCEGKTSLRKYLNYVTQTQFITQTPYDSKQDTISREFKVVEWRASSFVKNMLALRAKECRVAELGFLHSLSGGNRSAMGAVHKPTLLLGSCFDAISIPEVSLLCQGVV